MSKTPSTTIPTPTKYQASYKRPSGPAVRAAAANASRTPPPRSVRNAALTDNHTTQEGQDSHRADQDDNHAESPQGTLHSIGSLAKAYADKHGRALTYGLTGLGIAILMLIIGFWPTALLVAFAAIGVAIGRYRDGDARMQRMAANLTARIGK
ncbi:DUF2273 domain-containing protein [Adlercreutzia sp. ZJ138]|uniref:DUF2273 domain-containing protein n=1 Tax=Adlercreutzia sp. ZJ138 TaxID=2709405 RepID=UPI0013EBAE87|nr:DUF2273 domain-containing protein [Adlercreutzia sp. ZJ138]